MCVPNACVVPSLPQFADTKESLNMPSTKLDEVGMTLVDWLRVMEFPLRIDSAS